VLEVIIDGANCASEVPVGRVAEVPVDDAQGPEFAMATAINLAASNLAV
jgi:hypothetical protein